MSSLGYGLELLLCAPYFQSSRKNGNYVTFLYFVYSKLCRQLELSDRHDRLENRASLPVQAQQELIVCVGS